jgi:mannose-1-phosphate guanylyltransferase
MRSKNMKVVDDIRALSKRQQVTRETETSSVYLAAYSRTIFDFIHFYETGIEPHSILLRPWGNNVRKAILNSLDQLARNSPSPAFNPLPSDRISRNVKAVAESLRHGLGVLKTIAATTESKHSGGPGSETGIAIDNAVAAIASIFLELASKTRDADQGIH